MAKKKRGPRPKPAAEKRTNCRTLRMTDEETKRLKQLAAADCRNECDYILVRAGVRVPPTVDS